MRWEPENELRLTLAVIPPGEARHHPQLSADHAASLHFPHIFNQL
jgi:hypothetical protein